MTKEEMNANRQIGKEKTSKMEFAERKAEVMRRIQEWIPTANNFELITEFQNEAAIPNTDPDYFVVIETKGMLKAEILRRMAG